MSNVHDYATDTSLFGPTGRYRLEEFLSPPMLHFTPDEANAASDEWGFNCGPGALCCVLGMSPARLRPFLGDFESKGYTNPTLMFETLRRLGVKYQAEARNSIGTGSSPGEAFPAFGLARVQWGGPWTKPGVPMRARYRQTHWVASWRGRGIIKHAIFDVNACYWTDFESWKNILVPHILKECVPRNDGTWWITHSITIPVEKFGRWDREAGK